MTDSSIYQLKVTLKDSHPPIWRRIQASGDISLYLLHQILQVVMGWTNSHLHSFAIGDQEYGDPADDELGMRSIRNEMRYRLDQVIVKEGMRFSYTYDFGDDWEHTIQVEKILPREEGVQHPRCIKGKRACPPEDVGGIWGYEGFLEAYFDPKNPEHDSSVEWLGEGFDPEAFELELVNVRLNRLLAGGKRAELPVETEVVDILDEEVDFFGEDEEDNLWVPAWEEQPPEEWSQFLESLPFRQDVIIFLSYIRDHKVTGTQSTGNLPLKAVHELVDLLNLKKRAGEDLPEFRSEEDVWPLYFIHSLVAGAGLVDGGASQQWTLTDLGERFLAAPAIDQISHLVYNWYLDTEDNAILPDPNDPEMAAEDSPTLHLDAILNMPDHESVQVDSLVPQILGIPGQAWQVIGANEMRTFMHMTVEMMALIPLASFGVLIPGFGEEHIQAGEQQLVSVQITPFGKELLTAVQADVEEEF